MKATNEKDIVDKKTLKLYDDINGLDVIRELLLFKGVEICGDDPDKFVNIRDLEYSAHILYGLKVNATNKLYVGFYLDKFYKRAGLRLDRSYVKVPNSIYNEIKELNDSYKNASNQED
jgi:hypothetical protein